MSHKTIERRAIERLLSGDTGVSSEAMIAFFMDIPKLDAFGMGAPHDHADRGRCIRLLQAIPEWVERLDELKALDAGTVSINGAAPIPRSESTHSWTHQIPLIKKEGGL